MSTSRQFANDFHTLRGQARKNAMQEAVLRANPDLKPEAVSRQVAALRAAAAVGAVEMVRRLRQAHADQRAKIDAMRPRRSFTPLELAQGQRWLDQVVGSGDLGKIREAARDSRFRAVAALLGTPLDMQELRSQLANASDIPPPSTWYAEVVRQDHPAAADSAFAEADKLADLARKAAFLATSLPSAADAAAIVDQLGDDVAPDSLRLDDQGRAWLGHVTGTSTLPGAEITLAVAEQSLVARMTAAQPAPAPAPVLTANGAPVGGGQ